MAQTNSVYDQDSDEPHHTSQFDDTNDQLENGDSDQTDNEEQNATSKNDLASKERSASKQSPESGNSKNKPVGSSGLGAAESAAEDKLGSGFTAGAVGAATGTGSLGARVSAYVLRNRKKGGIGLGVGGGILAVIFFIFLALVPLKIENMVKTVQNRFGATAESAISSESQNMFEHYVVKHVLPSYKNCGTTITAKCKVRITSSRTNPVTNLYSSWADARLESTLATKYNIEFKYDSKRGTWMLKAPGTPSAGDPIGANGEKLDAEFKKSNRAQMRAAVKDAFEKETSWKKVYYRFKVGRLLEEKYGVRRCLVFCDAKDALADDFKAQKKTAQLYLVQRIVTPHDEMLGIALQCVLDPACQPSKTETTTSETSSPSQHGAPENDKVDGAMRTKLTEVAARYGVEDAAKLTATVAEIEEKGFQKYLTEKILKSIGLEAIAGTASDKIPYIGWINMLAEVINGSNEAADKLKTISYAINSKTAVAVFSMYRSYVDEAHTGNLTATEFGSMVSSLGSANASTTDLVGGTASAEQTPLYAAIVDGNASPTSIATSLTGSASAASSTTTTTNSSKYICANGAPVPAGQLVCDEEVLASGNSIANNIHNFVNLPFFQPVLAIAKIWKSTIGVLFNGLNYILGPVIEKVVDEFNFACDHGAVGAVLQGVGALPPGACQARDTINAISPQIMQAITQWLIVNPFGQANMSGGRVGDGIIAGGDVLMNDATHTTLGGQAITQQEANTIIGMQQKEARQKFVNQSFFARMFSTDSTDSMISHLALAVPFNTRSTMISSMASAISNPFHLIGSGLSTIATPRTSADVQLKEDPFGVTQYGYKSVPDDPEAYWDDYCSDNSDQAYQNDKFYAQSNWNQAAADNVSEVNGQPTNSSTNPCLLIKATTGATGGKFDSSNLTKDDLEGTTTQTQTPGNNSIYVLGDSLTVGMSSTSGGLKTKLEAAGWQPTINGTVGIHILTALEQAKHDSVAISQAGTVVIELGTNDYGASDSDFNKALNEMYTFVHTTNPTAHIYWVNYTASKEVWKSKLQQKTQLLGAFASANHITVIDWAGSSAAKYTADDTAMGIHPAQHYAEMTAVVVQALGSPPTTSIGGGGGGSGKFTTNTAIHYPDEARMLSRATTAVQLSGKLCPNSKTGDCYNLCAHVAGLIWGYSHTGYETAYLQWLAEVKKGNAHTGADRYNIPVGGVLYWKGSGADGHTAVYVGDGYVISTDVLGNGGVYRATATKVTSWMGSGTYLGWTTPHYNSPQDWPKL